MIHRATVTDLNLLMKAQQASDIGEGSLTAFQMMEQLLDGRLEAYVYETASSIAMLGLQVEGYNAVLGAWYREGPPASALTELRALLERVKHVMRNRGVTHLYCLIAKSHPKHDKLVRLYARLDFHPDLTRLSSEV